MVSCSSGDELTEGAENILEINYHSFYEDLIGVQERNLKYTNIKAYPRTDITSENEEIHVLQIIANAKNSDSCIMFEVIADSLGYNVLYNNFFDFRTPEGTPYNYSDLELIVGTNSEGRFMANFAGRLKHYNQLTCKYIYVNISSGVIDIKYELYN